MTWRLASLATRVAEDVAVDVSDDVVDDMLRTCNGDPSVRPEISEDVRMLESKIFLAGSQQKDWPIKTAFLPQFARVLFKAEVSDEFHGAIFALQSLPLSGFGNELVLKRNWDLLKMVFNLRSFSFTESIEDDPPSPPKSFSLKELRVVTHDFSRDNVLAAGGFGKVSQGRLADGSLMAVKRARTVDQCSKEQFETEVQVGRSVSTHPNVLRLRGFCRTKKELLLVYPLMINNSLPYNLLERPDRCARPLDWTSRKRIALEAARGLAHLHTQGDIKIMHPYICAASVLPNVQFEAMIGSFCTAVIMHERNAGKGTIEWRTRTPRRGTGISFSSPLEENSADSGFDSQIYHRYKNVYVDTIACGIVGFTASKYSYT
ncbi:BRASSINOSTEROID INSENSITIVE 1-associated receptor kinase 1-like [Rhodamnia argentea]|uniref:non-specific serine/threonine protein kinase n=1 Tax=Rhodamnia argentea TaxID=178133 RepID=A0A8B8NCI3_9MYRT|nr:BRASSINOSTEROID INSENSITIVE 1-associated receptor kinase 1-like [Rhodamnia argentea]